MTPQIEPWRKEPDQARFPGLTMRQRVLLQFIDERLTETGAAPSIREMSAEIRAGVETVAGLLGRIEERGFIERLPGKARAIRVIDQPRPWNSPLESYSVGELQAELRRRSETRVAV